MKELISQAIQNDEQAISQLMGIVGQKSKFIALSYVNNDDDKADDIVQESYIKAFSSLDKLEDPNKFESWFYRILNNTAKDKINRKLDKESSYFSELDYEDTNFEESIDDDYIEFQPKDNFDYSELKSGMKEVLEDLPIAQKQAVLMYYFEGLNAREIGEIFDVSEDTIRGRIRYAINKMKAKIEEMEKQGKSLRGIAPIPFLLWMLRTESGSVIPTKLTASSIATAIASSGTVAPSTQPPELPKRSTSVPNSKPSTSNVGNTPTGKPSIPKTGTPASIMNGTANTVGTATISQTAKEVLAGLSTKALAAITAGVIATGALCGYTVLSMAKPVETIEVVEDKKEEVVSTKSDSDTKTEEVKDIEEEVEEEPIEEEMVEELTTYPVGEYGWNKGAQGAATMSQASLAINSDGTAVISYMDHGAAIQAGEMVWSESVYTMTELSVSGGIYTYQLNPIDGGSATTVTVDTNERTFVWS